MDDNIKMSLRERVYKEIVDKRQKLLDGNINSIPTPFTRFKDDFIGIEQGTYICVTSFTKGGKSQFTSFVFIYKALLYAYYSKSDVKVTILYFPLEETPERIMQRFISYLLYDYTKGEIRISPKDLRSTSNDNPCPQEVLDMLENDEIKDILDYFESNIIFNTTGNPTGIYKACKQYAEEHGKVLTKKSKYKDDFGVVHEVDAFDRYVPDNPNEYKIIIIDTINLIDTEKGLNTKQSMDKLSEYLAKYLRNRYNFTPIVIQQQNFDSEGLEAFKSNKVRPSVAGLGDSKYVSRDANIVLGLFSPYRFGLSDYLGYDITKLKDNIRFLEVLVSRDGEMGGILPLYFDGAVCFFSEMPHSKDTNQLNKIYNLINKRKNTLFLSLSKNIKIKKTLIKKLFKLIKL